MKRIINFFKKLFHPVKPVIPEIIVPIDDDPIDDDPIIENPVIPVVPEIIIPIDTNVKMSKNFTLLELIKSATAEKYKISNLPNDEQIEHLKTLCTMCLQPVRDLYGLPIIVNNGFRSPELNLAMKNDGYIVSENSQHLKGEAADIRDAQIRNNKNLFDTIYKYGVFDQLIWEDGNDSYPDWVHVSCIKTGNRKEILRLKNGSTIYRKYDMVKWSS